MLGLWRLIACWAVCSLAALIASRGYVVRDFQAAASPKLNIVPLQFVGPMAIVFWSEGTWDRFRSSANASPSIKTPDESTQDGQRPQ